MRVVIHPSAAAAATAVAQFIADALRSQPDLALALPSGRTPVQLYRALRGLYDRREVDFRHASLFGLDEFVGIGHGDRRSYAAFLRRSLIDHVNVNAARVHLINGDANDPRTEALRFEHTIAARGGLDIAIVGVGSNGHVAFNEPAGSLSSQTHVVRLEVASRRSNAPTFGRWQSVPTHAISMGIGTILRARAVVLLARGGHKAGIVARACLGPVTTRVPASLLQAHPNVAVVLDRRAARDLII